MNKLTVCAIALGTLLPLTAPVQAKECEGVSFIRTASGACVGLDQMTNLGAQQREAAAQASIQQGPLKFSNLAIVPDASSPEFVKVRGSVRNTARRRFYASAIKFKWVHSNTLQGMVVQRITRGAISPGQTINLDIRLPKSALGNAANQLNSIKVLASEIVY